jgi:hypothetical protein
MHVARAVSPFDDPALTFETALCIEVVAVGLVAYVLFAILAPSEPGTPTMVALGAALVTFILQSSDDDDDPYDTVTT